MTSRQVWFKHKPGLLIVGRPVHWKGWLTGALYAAALLAIIFAVQSLSGSLDGDERLMVRIVGIGAGILLTVAFAFMAWPHRGRPE